MIYVATKRFYIFAGGLAFVGLGIDVYKRQAQADEKTNNMPAKEMGFVSVSIGEGMNEVFRGLGAGSDTHLLRQKYKTLLSQHKS